MAEALLIASAAVSTVGTLMASGEAASAAKAEGKANDSLAKYQAAQLEYKAGQERAVSQKRAIEERRKATRAGSRARAVAAASGAGASDPTVMDILAVLRGEGDYNAGVALYEGEETAKGLEEQAMVTRAEGKYAKQAGSYRAKSIRRAGYMEAAGNLIKGGSTYYSKYWPDEEAVGATGDGGNRGTQARTRWNWG